MTDSSHEGMAVWLIRTVALLVPALPVAAIAGDWELPSDVGVTLTAFPTSQLRVGQPIDITFTATNNGLEELPVVITESNRFVDEFDVVDGSWTSGREAELPGDDDVAARREAQRPGGLEHELARFLDLDATDDDVDVEQDRPPDVDDVIFGGKLPSPRLRIAPACSRQR